MGEQQARYAVAKFRFRGLVVEDDHAEKSSGRGGEGSGEEQRLFRDALALRFGEGFVDPEEDERNRV